MLSRIAVRCAGAGALMVVLLAGCGEPPLEEAIVGTWKDSEGMLLRFGPDGALTMVAGPLTIPGRYSVAEDGLVDVSLTYPMGGGVERDRWPLSVAGKTLQLCDSRASGKPCPTFTRAED